MFFQSVLLLAYGYAHLLSLSRLSGRRRVGLHLLVLLLPLGLLPLSLPVTGPPAGVAPEAWLLGTLALRVGAPVFAVSATAPLLQRWFSASGDRRARDPYFLYAASNLGSLVALLSYPLLLERLVPLSRQRVAWSVGYGVLWLLEALCAAPLLRGAAAAAAADVADAAEVAPGGPPAAAGVRFWLILSALPAALLVGVTTYLTTDIAAAPLLWVGPLGLYLLSFVLVAGPLSPDRRPGLSRGLRQALPPLLLLLLLLTLLRHAGGGLLIPLHLLVFFGCALLCHGEALRRRPPPRRLTAFYFYLSLGGVLGGAACALLAPRLLPTVAEYPLALGLSVLCVALVPAPAAEPARPPRLGPTGSLASLILGLLLVAPALAGPARSAVLLGLAYAAPLWLGWGFRRRPVALSIGVGALWLVFAAAGVLGLGSSRRLLTARSFFGVVQVQVEPRTGDHLLIHGTTLHGRQHFGAGQPSPPEPLLYFHRSGPVGQVFAAGLDRRLPVAVVGLGVGTLASYAAPGQPMTFYEIDPAVVQVAKDPRLFTYLADSPGAIRVELGDARLRLRAAPAGGYGMIVLDAFSSDAVPVHLLTREALAEYLQKLAPGGVVLVDITNRYFALQPMLAALAADAGLCGLVQEDLAAGVPGKADSTWVVLARRPADLQPLQPLRRDSRWRPLPPGAPAPWRDDFADPLQVFRWQRAY